MDTKKAKPAKRVPKGYIDAIPFLEKYLGGSLTLGGVMEAIRLGEDMTQPAFAKNLGISKANLNDIEKGRKLVSPARAARFAKLLGYSERQFIQLSLQALLDKEGIDLKVDLKAA
jgi:transcriptional regulator with XRE-family HTH domain